MATVKIHCFLSQSNKIEKSFSLIKRFEELL